MRNSELVGSTGQKIIFAGDSAGGNISTAALIKCIEMGVPKPAGLFNAYTIYLVNFVKSPSRITGFFDTFLNFHVVMKIFKCYGDGKPLNVLQKPQESGKKVKRSEGSEIPAAPEDEHIFELPKSYLLSPFWAPDEILREFPPTRLVTMITDPCIDDCVDFGKKLRRLNVDTQIDVLGGLFHGFLSFIQVRRMTCLSGRFNMHSKGSFEKTYKNLFLAIT